MNHRLKKIAYWFLTAGMVGVISSFYLLTHHTEVIKNNQLAALLMGQEAPLRLDAPQKSSDCQVKNQLPDHYCTPGAVFADAVKEKICVQGYAKTVRSVPENLRKKVYEEYQVAYPQAYGSYEVDHLIPLALGGSNEIANLWIQAANPTPGFKEKDVVENYLHQEVCAGHVALSIAQEKIAGNWLLIYQNLDPETIAVIKAKYHNWASN